MVGEQGSKIFDGSVRELRDIAPLLLECHAAVLQTRGLDHLLEQRGDLIRLGDQQWQHRLRLRGHIAKRAGSDHRQVALDDRHRSTQLMRCDVQELGLGFLEAREPVCQGYPVQARGDAACVLPKPEHLVLPEQRGERSGDDRHRTPALLELKRQDEGRVTCRRMRCMLGRLFDGDPARDQDRPV